MLMGAAGGFYKQFWLSFGACLPILYIPAK